MPRNSYILHINLSLRRGILRIYKLLTPFISKTGIGKIPFKGKKSGFWLYWLFTRILFYKIPEPIEANGLLMYTRAGDDRLEFGWLYAFDYEPETCVVLKKIIKPGMTFVDIGANIGYYTLLTARLLAGKGSVYAFEPDPAYYGLLVKNIHANNLDGIVEAHQYAVGNKGGRISIYLGKSTGSGIFKTPDATEKRADVDLVSLDAFFQKRSWPAIHVIKIDIEGAEILALEGMQEVIKRNPGLKLAIECHPQYLSYTGSSAEKLLLMLEKLGFHQVLTLNREKKTYRLPEEIPSVIESAGKTTYANLFCERRI